MTTTLVKDVSAEAQQAIESFFRKKVQKDPKIHNAYFMVHSEKLGLHIKLSEGSTEVGPTHPDQPYHIASVSKLFAGVLIAMLVEKGLCSYEDPISLYLDQDILHNLHVHKGTDYTKDIQIKHLLNHTSGLHDFLEDKPKQTKSIPQIILDEPDHALTPLETINWAKENLPTHFPPGKGFHYSDTGYHLVGFIVEKITNKAYHEVIHEYIFEPLEMKQTYFGHYSQPAEKSEHPLSSLFFFNNDITQYKSLHINYSGGAIVSTTEDLLKFMKALVNHQLLKEETIQTMKQDWGRFVPGINYGYGVMDIVGMPVLMPKKFSAWGNAGSTGSVMFYHPGTDSYLIGTMNQFGYGPKGIRFMLQVIDKLIKHQAKN